VVRILEKAGEKRQVGRKLLFQTFLQRTQPVLLENWSYSEINHTSRILGGHMNELIYLSEPGNPQVSSWYNLKEIARLYGLFLKI